MHIQVNRPDEINVDVLGFPCMLQFPCLVLKNPHPQYMDTSEHAC
jgi:hypothetical protein